MLKKILPYALSIFLLVVGLWSKTCLATIVRIQTVFGVIDISLYDEEAPLTVANFLNYIDSGDFNHSIVHRSLPGVIIQSGGYWVDIEANTLIPIVPGESIVNEFSPERSNIRGTIAMAKRPDLPDSAVSQWFINVGDNSEDLDTQTGGFTVFGRVIGNGMQVIDTINELPVINVGGVFSNLPTINYIEGEQVGLENFVLLELFSNNIDKFNSSDSDRLFAYLEAFYPNYLSPANPLQPSDEGSILAEGYYYRYYPDTDAYIGTANNTLYYLGSASEGQIIPLGSISDWLAEAIAEGY